MIKKTTFAIGIIAATTVAGLLAASANKQGSALPPPVTDADFLPATQSEAELGRLLFWDSALSGNRNISCGTCHHPKFGTSDGLSLGVGEGGIGLGPDRKADPQNYPEQRIPRNSPALWNTGANQYTVFFADGRLESDPAREGGIRSPLEDDMVSGFKSLLSAQAMFPVLSPDEMAGHYSENDIAKLVRSGRLTGPDGAWAAIAKRVSAIPEYQARFEAVYPEIADGRAIAFTDISNAIAAFVTVEFRSDTSPFDLYLRGADTLTADAKAGMDLFYGKAGCASCHSGPFQTDMQFHAMGDPQLGPGKGERFESHQRDTGRMRISNDPADLYAFRTPSLRNVTLTAPYGHAGAHRDLTNYVRSHLDPAQALLSYKPDAVLVAMEIAANDWAELEDREAVNAIAASVKQPPVLLDDSEISQLIAFLSALEDPVAAKGGRMGIPDAVPSGLAVDR